jgi:hypothetical protein
MGVAWSFGATDRSIPDRMAELIADYTEKIARSRWAALPDCNRKNRFTTKEKK